MKLKDLTWVLALSLPIFFAACSKDNDHGSPVGTGRSITIENILQSKSLVESGTFQQTGASPLIMPGQSVSFKFSAAYGQTITFAAMYGYSSDMFFAPANPGITLYDADKNPIEGDVSKMVKLWDNGTRVNQAPGPDVSRPGTPENNPIKEVEGKDEQGNTYLNASSLVKATLKYDGDSYFTLTLENTSGGTANETPLSPGVWAVSYIAGGSLLNAAPLYEEGKPTTNGLTALAETGSNTDLANYIKDNTGIFTPLSPILVVTYTGADNPLFKVGQKDPGNGLMKLAQQGDATDLASALKKVEGVTNIYVLSAESSTVLLPAIGDQSGSKVTQKLQVTAGEHLAIATMYGFSNDWFFASTDNIDPSKPGDYSSTVKLYDDGTAVDQYPGAGNSQFNLGGNVVEKDNEIQEVPNPNIFTTLPKVTDMIKVTIE